MAKRYRRSSRKRHRSKLSASNAGPILALLATVFGILTTIALVVFVLLPRVLPLIGIRYQPPWQPTPTPLPTVRPSPTPHPILELDPIDMQHEVELPSSNEALRYRWFADPYVYGNRLLFVAGRQVEGGDIHMDALFSLDMASDEVEKLEIVTEYQDIVYPVFNANWLVYMDSMAGGGGAIRARNWNTGETIQVKRVYTGQPKLHLDGNYLAWMERTGSTMDKLFMMDLTTMETVAVETFSNTSYGQSDISLQNGQLIYAYEDDSTGGQGASSIHSIALETGLTDTVYPGTYVHDPMTNGSYWVWRDGLHGESNSLYISKGSNTSRRIAENIVDYGISDTFVAYSQNNEPIRIYLFDREIELVITPGTDQERTQLLGVSNGVVIWMDVTSRERDILKYARVE